MEERGKGIVLQQRVFSSDLTIRMDFISMEIRGRRKLYFRDKKYFVYLILNESDCSFTPLCFRGLTVKKNSMGDKSAATI